jgi:DNA-binding transcriptional ArsR family regulator
MSVHLSILQRAGFVVSTRRGQWTYYRRDETRIRAFCERLHHDL